MDRLISELNAFFAEHHASMPTFSSAVLRVGENMFAADAEQAVVFKVHFEGVRLMLELYYLRYPHGIYTSFKFRGREYARDVNYLVTNFFDRRYKGVFYVGDDISSVSILEPMVVTRDMAANSRLIAEQFGSDPISEDILTQDVCFLEQNVTRIAEIPTKTVLRELTIAQFAELAHVPNHISSEQHALITRYWYKVLYSLYVGRLIRVVPHTDEVEFVVIGLSISLSLLSVLRSPDNRTWYMRVLGLEPCMAQQRVDSAVFDQKVREVRNMKVVDLLRRSRAFESRALVDMMSLCHHVSPSTTLHDFVGTMVDHEYTWFDYVIVMVLNAHVFVEIHDRLDDVGTFSPCRQLAP